MSSFSENEKSPIYVALDVDSAEEALSLAKAVAPFVGGFKLGPRLLVRHGESLIRPLADLGEVFVDNKYHDIPSTMLAAVKASFAAGASLVTVHAASGAEALSALAELEAELSKERPFRILAVTVLTSFSEGALPAHWKVQPLEELVRLLAKEVLNSGLSGLVCSAQEVTSLRQLYPSSFLLTPGIRLPNAELEDQKRVVTPFEAMLRGASALVVGRPIVKADDPRAAAKAYWESIKVQPA